MCVCVCVCVYVSGVSMACDDSSFLDMDTAWYSGRLVPVLGSHELLVTAVTLYRILTLKEHRRTIIVEEEAGQHVLIGPAHNQCTRSQVTCMVLSYSIHVSDLSLDRSCLEMSFQEGSLPGPCSFVSG